MPCGHGHARDVDPYLLGRGGGHGSGHVAATGHGDGGPASKRVVVGYGFWLFLLSDIVLFSCLFAAHAVLQTAIAGGPAGHELFDPTNIAIETACLLLSSFTCGMSAVACGVRNLLWTQVALLVTGLLGLAFLVLEANEFAELVAQGFGPQRSAFLSSFFAVVGCHGLHVTAGLLWLGTMMAQIFVKGFAPTFLRRHALLQSVLARARHHLGGAVHDRLSDRRGPMSDDSIGYGRRRRRLCRAARIHGLGGIQGYLFGLVLAALLTAASFYVVYTHLIWAPAIPIALVVLAVAQIGVHLVFFLHLTTAPDNTNNVLALAFGVLIVALIIGGSVWIMGHLE